jgi:hypothetical protein
MINNTNVGDAISYLLKDNDTFEKLKTDFPDILADLLTFRNNPSCSCKGRVIKFFSAELQKDPAVLNKYVKDTNDLTKTLSLLAQQRAHSNYSGRILKIDNTEEAWQNLSVELTGKMFRSFSVVDKGSQLWVYLL